MLPMPKSDGSIRALFVSTSYPRDTGDWRGVFMSHVSMALARQDHVRLAQWTPPGCMDDRVEFVATPREAEWLAHLMSRGGISHWLRTRPISGFVAASKLLWFLRRLYRRLDDVDIYHINWLQCALPLPANKKPALLTVLGNDMRLLQLPLMRSAMRHAIGGRRTAICPNASWMEAPLREVFGDRAIVATVPFGIDPRWYAVQRRIGDIGNPPKWLAITRLTTNKLGPLFEWSEPLFRGTRRELHLFGPMQECLEVPDWIHYHGSVTQDELANEWFPLAQGLITLSRHAEGRPQVMLEAMAAKLPIVASRMPAHADIVTENVTGMLCDDPRDYASALTYLEEPVANLHMGDAARAWAAREIGTWDDCAARYTRIYRRLLGAAGNG